MFVPSSTMAIMNTIRFVAMRMLSRSVM